MEHSFNDYYYYFIPDSLSTSILNFTYLLMHSQFLLFRIKPMFMWGFKSGDGASFGVCVNMN